MTARGHMLLLNLIAMLSGGCDLFGTHWRVNPGISQTFDVTATRAVSPTEVLFAGHSRGPLASQHALIFAWSGAPARTVYQGAGYVVAMDGRRSTVWAIRGQPRPQRDGSNYFLVKSDDAGATWREIGAIAASSITQLLAVSEREAWVRGAGVLERTVDGGVHWTSVDAPRAENIFDESLSLTTSGVVLALEHRALTSSDGGKSWAETCSDCGRVHLIDHGVILAERSPGVFQLKWNGKWGGAISYPMIPFRLDVTDRIARILASPTGSDVGSGLVLFTTKDAGSSFSRSRIPVAKFEAVDVFHGGRVFALDVAGNVLTTDAPPSIRTNPR